MSARRLWLCGLLVGLAASLHHPLMAVYRGVWASRFPSYVEHWPNNGPFTLLGALGMEDSDELQYAALAVEFSRRVAPHDPYVATGKPWFPKDYLTFLAMGTVHRLAGDINATWFLLRILAGALWFVLLFRLARLSGIPDGPALFCAAFGTCFAYILGLFFIYDLHWAGGLLKTLARSAWTVVSYGRTENTWRLPRPGLTYAALFAAVVVFARALGAKTLGPWLAAGAAGGALAYVRLDVWTGFVGGACVFPPLTAALQRRWDWRWAAPAALSLAIGLPVLPWLLNPPAEFLAKAGMGPGRQVDWQTVLYLPFLALALRRRPDGVTALFSSLALAVIAVSNASLVTGRLVYAPNWRSYGNVFIFLLAISLLPRRWLDRERLWKGLTAATLAAAVGLNVLYAGIRYPWHGLPKDQAEALRWLKANAPADSVVATTSFEAVLLIPPFTRSKTLFGNAAPLLSELPLAENVVRTAYAVAVLGGEPKAFFGRVFQAALEPPKPGALRTALDRIAGEFELGYSVLFGHVPPPDAQGLVERTLADGIPSFPVDYVWVSPFDRLWMATDFPEASPLKLERVFATGGVELYRVLGRRRR